MWTDEQPVEEYNHVPWVFSHSAWAVGWICGCDVARNRLQRVGLVRRRCSASDRNDLLGCQDVFCSVAFIYGVGGTMRWSNGCPYCHTCCDRSGILRLVE